MTSRSLKVVWRTWRKDHRFVPVILIVIALGIPYVMLLIFASSSPASRQAQVDLENELGVIQPAPQDRAAGHSAGNKPGSAIVTQHYGTERPHSEVRAYYDVEFQKHGWVPCPDKKSNPWRSSEAGPLFWCKGKYKVVLEYSTPLFGNEGTYSLSFVWEGD